MPLYFTGDLRTRFRRYCESAVRLTSGLRNKLLTRPINVIWFDLPLMNWTRLAWLTQFIVTSCVTPRGGGGVIYRLSIFWRYTFTTQRIAVAVQKEIPQTWIALCLADKFSPYLSCMFRPPLFDGRKFPRALSGIFLCTSSKTFK